MTDFASLIQPDRGQPARTLHIVHPDAFDGWLKRQPPAVRASAAAHRVTGQAGDQAVLPGAKADEWTALLVCDEPLDSPWRFASQATALPAGTYRLDGPVGAGALGWLLAQHRFDRYKAAKDNAPRILLTGEPARLDATVALAAATALVRDLIDTPASDLGPAELADAVEAVGKMHGATPTITKGHALETGYPLIHAVGQAAAKGREPRLIELEWGDPKHPRIAIVGKGVCFDTGGLDIKPSAGMRLMKKDKGGAAHALALAQLVMHARLPVRLHLLIPAVENAVSAASARPGDVHHSRQGLTVENTNTDAEGRLILADALTRAGEGKPALILDFATLTGAARVALGPDLPPLFANDDALADDLLAAAAETRDPLWRMPLWDPYDDLLKSDIADLVNAPEGGFAGAVTAALFLRRFVPADIAWAHLDVFGWRPVAKPGRPKGGEAYGLRAAWQMLQSRYK
ncbi:MAG: leucyl aminopeptidase family protein [Pseudomonadota bacterium]